MSEPTHKPTWRHPLMSGLLAFACLVLAGVCVAYWPLDGERKLRHGAIFDGSADEALVFFGFPGCGTVCPPSLRLIAERAHGDELDAYFVNLRPGSNEQATRAYARAIDPALIALTPGDHERQRLSAEFLAHFYPLPGGNNASHTGTIYRIRRQEGRWTITHRYRDAAEFRARYSEHAS